ncbi:MAG: M14 metallopeptidase family protein [Acidobacteriota bacterium]
MTFRRVCPMLTLIFLAVISGSTGSTTASESQESVISVPLPESSLGFKIGTDRELAKWDQFLDYFKRLDLASDRVQVTELGKTTLGRPFVVATISSASNLKRLDELKEIQRQLADPRGVDPRKIEGLIAAGKTVVVITCSIHSTEVGGTFSATEMAYRLASGKTPEVEQILNEVVLLLVPSLNPDGTDMVADWYRQTLGTPSEGTSPPGLYHHYTGHDNNRDWYAFTQVETRLTVDKILNIWRPQILHDVHQMGATGARYFVPPYTDPWEPNVDPTLIAGVNALGSAMAWEVTSQGKRGVLINGMFDAWTPARAYPHYHAGLRILSETASARLATPIEVPAGSLGQGIGYHAGTASWNFPKPWPGGRWTIRDIIDYQTSGAMALLGHAARYRERYLRNFYEVSKRAVEAEGGPFAFLLPEPELPASIRDAAQRLTAGLRKAQGTPEEQHDANEKLTQQITSEPSTGEEVRYYLKIEGLDRVLATLKRGGVEVRSAGSEFTADGRVYPMGTHVILMKQPYGSFAKALLEVQRYPDLREYPGGPPRRPYDVTAHTLPLLMSVNALAIKAPFEANLKMEPPALVIQGRVRSESPARVALYKSYYPSMDEGWTRWLFDQYKFPFVSVVDQDVKSGGLRAKYDVIIIPDQSVNALRNGLPAQAGNSPDGEGVGGPYPPEVAGGLGDRGTEALRRFVEEGGTLVTFNNASRFAIEQFKLPVRDVAKGVSARDFYCPGSILRTELDETSQMAFGLEKQSIAWFEGSPIFEVTDSASARVIARYPEGVSPLLSGWILGDQLLRGKAALVEVKLGKGRVILFGFRPQYRGQSLATVPLIFNAILTSTTGQ